MLKREQIKVMLVYKREHRQRNGRRKMTNFIRAERRQVLSGESGASEGLRRQERERTMFQVQLHNINKQLNVSKDQLTRNLPLLTSMAEHTQTHTSVAQRTRGTSCAWQFKGLLECGL